MDEKEKRRNLTVTYVWVCFEHYFFCMPLLARNDASKSCFFSIEDDTVEETENVFFFFFFDSRQKKKIRTSFIPFRKANRWRKFREKSSISGKAGEMETERRRTMDSS